MPDFTVISDAPASIAADRLAFSRYVDPIETVLTDLGAQTPFTIGIFGTWGSGKSTVLRMVAEVLADRHPGKFVCVQFDPWVHRRERNMLVPLLHALNDSLVGQKERFHTALRGVGRILVALGSDLLLKTMTANIVSLKSISEASKAVAQTTSKVESEMRRLRNTLQDTANAISAKGARLVLFIDNLDRCQPDQIIDVLESVKLFLDLQHVFVLLAIDKEVVDRGIQVRFKDFQFGDRAGEIGAEYLEKVVQLPLALYPLKADQVGRFIEALGPSDLVRQQLKLLERVVSPNPRKIKRVINILNVSHAVSKGTKGLDLKPELLARMVVLQVQSPDLFTEIVQIPSLLAALEMVYQGRKKLGNQDHFQEYGSLRDVIQKRCTEFYRPESYLADLLKNSDFSASTTPIRDYLSMVGV